ncbi:TerC family protein [Brevibacillus ginsengisoli]|uniref:TerC family protein n=1 Tax=Brevibacillus ginsengisoli TaxID=363854 RepID=UPI003CE6B9F7
MDGNYWIAFFNIIVIDLVLSGDNAVVIGMACRGLAPKEQKEAVLYGTLGAVILRVGLTAMATWMLNIPFLKLFGGLMLFWISIKILTQHESDTSDVAYGRNLSQAIKTIILADFIMSLDNVLAVGGAAHGDVWLVLFGLGLSIPLLMWGSSLVARLINRFPFIMYVGSAILAYTAAEMCVEDPYISRFMYAMPFFEMVIPLLATMAVIMIGRFMRKA